MIIVAILIVGVIYLAHKAPDPNATPTGEPNGTSTSGMVLGTDRLPPDRSLAYLGTNGTPSPLSGRGFAGASGEALGKLNAISPFARQRASGNGVSGGTPYVPSVRSQTGVLNPLPDNGATKKLQTQQVQPLTRRKF